MAGNLNFTILCFTQFLGLLFLRLKNFTSFVIFSVDSDYEFLALSNSQDDLAQEVTSNHEAVMKALSKGAGRSMNVAFRLFLGLLINLPLTLAFGHLFFIAWFWYCWWTRRHFVRNWWLDLALKYGFSLLWPLTIFVFGFLAAKDLSVTRFAKERPHPDEVAKSLQSCVEILTPYWLGVLANTDSNPALTAAVSPQGQNSPLAQVPIPSAFLTRFGSTSCQVCHEASPRFPPPKRRATPVDPKGQELQEMGATGFTSSPKKESENPFSQRGSGGFGSIIVEPISPDPLTSLVAQQKSAT